jgi:hypothetical protein
MTASATQQAVRNAYQTWASVSCAAFTVKDLGVVNLSWGSQDDGVNTNVWTPSWPNDYDPHAMAITWTLYDPQSGDIGDADTHYNPNDTWSSTGDPNAIDAQSVATHEIGHQFGLDHSPVLDATMYYGSGPGDTSMRSLSADDIAGICHIYPSGIPVPPECTTSAQCGLGEVCQNQKCVSSSQKAYGSACGNSKECASGLCVDTGSGSQCTEECSAKACPGGDQCLPMTGGGNACLPGSAPTGTKGLGQPCDDNSQCASQICVMVSGKGRLCSQTCDVQSQTCPSGYTCLAGDNGALCLPDASTPLPKKALGDACTDSSQCESNLCALTEGGHVCIQLCQRDAPGACPAGFACAPVSGSDQGACIREGTPPPPEPGQLGAQCTTNEDCASGICAISGEGQQFCTELCDPQSGCPESYECVSAGDSQFACARASGNGNPGTTVAKGGCTYADAARSNCWGLFLLIAPLVLMLRRRRIHTR